MEVGFGWIITVSYWWLLWARWWTCRLLKIRKHISSPREWTLLFKEGPVSLVGWLVGLLVLRVAIRNDVFRSLRPWCEFWGFHGCDVSGQDLLGCDTI